MARGKLVEARVAAMLTAHVVVEAKSEVDRMVGAAEGAAKLPAAAASPAEVTEAASAAEAAGQVA